MKTVADVLRASRTQTAAPTDIAATVAYTAELRERRVPPPPDMHARIRAMRKEAGTLAEQRQAQVAKAVAEARERASKIGA